MTWKWNIVLNLLVFATFPEKESLWTDGTTLPKKVKIEENN